MADEPSSGEHLAPHPGPSRRRLLIAVSVVAVVAVVAAAAGVFGGGSKEQEVVQAGSAGTTATTGSSSTGGIGTVKDVLPDPAIDLADDVVIVRSDNGKAVKRFDPDGRHLVIDAAAEGADGLAQGKVMLLTGVAVARVASLERRGDELVIEGGPLTLPELIDNGELAWTDEVMDFRDARVFLAPSAAGSESGGGTGTSGTSGTTGTTVDGEEGPSQEQIDDIWGDVNDILGGEEGSLGSGPARFALQPVAYRAAPADAAKPLEMSGDLGDEDDPITWHLLVNPDPDKPTFHTDLKMGDDVGGEITLDVALEELAHSGNVGVKDKEVKLFSAKVKDFKGTATVTAQVQALGNVAAVMTKPLVRLPIEVEVPFVVAGIPFNFSFAATVQVNLSMAMASNTLGGTARIEFAGPAGFEFKDAALTVNGQRVESADNLLDTVKGAVSGPVGLVVTAELPKLGIGLGWGWFAEGDVFFSNGMVASFHILPMPAPCTATNIAHVIAAGAEASVLGGLWNPTYRQPIHDQRWEHMVPNDGRCNAGP